MTYAEAISELQQRSLDALKVARSSQRASFETTREFAQTLSAQRRSAFVAPTALRAMTDLTTAFAFALLEQQVAYAKNLADAFAKPPVSAAPPAQPPPHLAIAAAPPTLTATAPLDAPVESEVPADAVLTPIDNATAVVAADAIAAADAMTLPVDSAFALATDDMTALATGDATVPATDDAVTPATDDAVTPATDDAVTLATDETSLGEPAPMEGSAQTPSPPPQTEEVFSKTFAVLESPLATSSFPVSSGNAARKPPKAKPVSNSRPKPKRNPGI